MAEVISVASKFSEQFYEDFHVPVFTYGELSPNKRRLKDIREKLGYFETVSSFADASKKIKQSLEDGIIVPDYGSCADYSDIRGVTCVGVVPLIVNFNMRFRTIDPREQVLKVTKAVRNSEVEALTLPYQDETGSLCYEVACNLRAPKTITKEIILAKAEEISKNLQLEITHSYTTGPTEDELLNLLSN